MKFSVSAVVSLLMADKALAFAPPSFKSARTSSKQYMSLDMPAPSQENALPVIQPNSYGPADVRYSDFLKLVNADKIEKVTFSADGTQLLGVDVDGVRLKIEALPNDPDLLSQLTSHKVCMCICMRCCCHWIVYNINKKLTNTLPLRLT